MMPQNAYPYYAQNMQGLNPELLSQLYKEYELVNTLHTLYYKVIETNPGERFIRFAKKNRREAEVLNADRKFSNQDISKAKVELGIKEPEAVVEDIDSHVKVALEFWKIKGSIKMNPRLDGFKDLPILDKGNEPEIAEAHAKRVRRSSFKIQT